MSTALLPRIMRTPVTRLMFGKIGPGIPVTATLDESALPEEIKQLVRTVVRRTRLWERERRDVVAELTDHFADAIERGRTAAEATGAFGNARKAAKLIRRGKIRNRPPWWKVTMWCRNAIATVMLAYAALLTAFLVGRPAVTVDYVARYNAAVTAAPEAARGWPMYRLAIEKMHGATEALKASGLGDDKHVEALLASRPGHRKWEDLKTFLAAHREVVELARQGAERPTLGYSENLTPSRPDKVVNDDSGGMLDVSMPELNSLRRLADVVEADAEVARADGDAGRFTADVRALLGIGAQMNGRGTFVEQLVGRGITGRGCGELDRALAGGKPQLDEDQLAALAHQLGRSPEHLDMTAERLLFYDCVQRVYTDGGPGGGFLNRRGARALQVATAISGVRRQTQRRSLGGEALDALVLTASPAVVASRREAVAEYDRLMGLSQRNLDLPMRQADWRPIYDRVQEIRGGSALQSARYVVVADLIPYLEGQQRECEIVQGWKEGLVTAIACEAYRRQHRAYPAKLDDLVPVLLPAVPADRIDGQPLRYKVSGGRPLIYSVGVDGVDDGGLTPMDIKGHDKPFSVADEPALWNRWRGFPISRGDWVLFPSRDASPAPDPWDEVEEARR